MLSFQEIFSMVELLYRGSLVSLQLIVQIEIHGELSFRPGYQREQQTRVLSPVISPKILYYLIILIREQHFLEGNINIFVLDRTFLLQFYNFHLTRRLSIR